MRLLIFAAPPHSLASVTRCRTRFGYPRRRLSRCPIPAWISKKVNWLHHRLTREIYFVHRSIPLSQMMMSSSSPKGGLL